MATNSIQQGSPLSPQALDDSQASESLPGPVHKRTYQACIPCRKRKVRCDLGPVDDPREPPCVRCRRESKECYFSATRRKRKTDEVESEQSNEGHVVDDYAQRNGRKVARTGTAITKAQPEGRRSLTAGSFSAASPLDGYTLAGDGSFQQHNSGRAIAKSEDSQDQEVANDTAAALFQSPINIPGDALHLLLKASNQSEFLQRKDIEAQRRHSRGPSAPGPSSTQESYRYIKGVAPQTSQGSRYESNIDPAIAADKTGNCKATIPKETLDTWSRLRFVRAGWFTAREGILYINYFYDFINPLTPISLPKIRSYADHPDLLKDEPMLTITMLTIASRYMMLPGSGGQSRSFMIHEKLWSYLQDMITRMTWGQEQFGGGFCGAGARRLGQTNAIKGGLRTLGTIESLLLLNEFHPRSMHFPPTDDDDEILAPSEDDQNNHPPADDSALGGSSTIADWSEPALRSDRMCWSLIGTSYVLAYEMGIFGTYSDGILCDGRVKRHGGSPEYMRRANRIERILYVFIIQASGRFGLPSMYSTDVNRFSLASLDDNSLSAESTLPSEPVDKTHQLWVELMIIMKACNDQLFSTKDQTAALIQSGEYVQRLQRLQPLLHKWKLKFKDLEVPKHARCIIAIEYHYISLYINSLALQAVLEQWTGKLNARPQTENPASPASSISSSYATLYSRNETYIREVIDSSKVVLRHVVEGLLPDDQLKHAPVRTYFRIVSAAMFLLKTFALGGKQDEVAISLRLLDDTVRALRTSVVDDVHICLRIADLLEGLTSSIRSQFVRLPPRPLSSPEQARRTAQQNLDSFGENAQAYGQSDRFPYRTTSGDVFQNPLAGISRTYNNPHDSNIAIMPPIGNTYANNNYNVPNANAGILDQQYVQQQYAMSQNSNNNDFSMFNDEDWLTLDINPLLDPSGLNNGSASEINPWFGAFGPETHNNLEVLGKLVNDQSRPDGGYEDGGMGF